MSSERTDQGAVSSGAVVRRFVPYMRKRWALISGSGLAMFLEVGFRLLEPWPLKFIFDAALHETGRPSTGIETLDAMSPGALLTACAIGLVAVVSLRAGAAYLRRVGFALAGNLVLTEVRGDLFAHVQRLSLSYHNRRRTGDLASRLTGDVGRLQEIVSTAVLPLAAHILTVFGVAVVMLLIEWRLALVAFAVLPLFWLSTQRIGRKIRTTARRERQRHGEMGAIATETLGSIDVVQSLGAEGAHSKRFGSRNLSSLKEGVRGKRLAAQLLGTADVFIALGTAIMLWYGARLVIRGDLELTTLLVFFFYHKNMTRPIRNVAKYSARTAKAWASAERIVEVLEQAPDIRESPTAKPAPTEIPSVRFEDVSFGYSADTPVIRAVSLRADAGTVTAIVGQSGAGKSTLLSLLLRLYDPDSGQIEAGGRTLDAYTIASWRDRVAVVPQETTLFADTVAGNIALGRPEASRELVTEAARLAGADEFIQTLPDGYDTPVGERGATLSKGQRQRIAIARAALREAPIVVFDEPTSSLDARNAATVWNAIRGLAQDRVCLVITHDVGAVSGADQILCLSEGTIEERGTHEQLISMDGVYARRLHGHRSVGEVVDA